MTVVKKNTFRLKNINLSRFYFWSLPFLFFNFSPLLFLHMYPNVQPICDLVLFFFCGACAYIINSVFFSEEEKKVNTAITARDCIRWYVLHVESRCDISICWNFFFICWSEDCFIDSVFCLLFESQGSICMLDWSVWQIEGFGGFFVTLLLAFF